MAQEDSVFHSVLSSDLVENGKAFQAEDGWLSSDLVGIGNGEILEAENCCLSLGLVGNCEVFCSK